MSQKRPVDPQDPQGKVLDMVAGSELLRKHKLKPEQTLLIGMIARLLDDKLTDEQRRRELLPLLMLSIDLKGEEMAQCIQIAGWKEPDVMSFFTDLTNGKMPEKAKDPS